MSNDARDALTAKSSQADVLHDTPERFDPVLMHGQLIEAEHVGRYSWASPLAEGKRVLDAGCGTGYGSTILAEAGAAEVIGVDIDEETIQDAENSADGQVNFMTADVRQLPFPDSSFDLVVCFELLEHLEETDDVLDELARVVSPEGILVVSSPNRDVYPPGNPHHRHEFRPEELAEALGRRFEQVRLVRQHDWLASTILDDDGLARPRTQAELHVLPQETPGEELYSLALASTSDLPKLRPYVSLTTTADVKWWQDRLQALQEELRASGGRAARAEAERDRESEHSRSLARRLLATETEIAKDRQARALSESKLADAREELRRREEELRHREEQLAQARDEIASMQATRAWRLAATYWRARDRIRKLLRLSR